MSGKMWEIDPETRSKLLEISKTNENNRCVDCGAPSPQWASPKFGIFFCLACSGIHRSLGVHISFVRSVTMDAFKTAEVERMRLGGNKPWKDFFNAHASNRVAGRDFESCTIAERYDSEAGEEWKERLTAKVEGREYVPVPKEKKADGSAARVKTGVTPVPSGRNTPVQPPTSSQSVRSAAPTSTSTTAQRPTSPSQKSRNEAFFARMGEENASRPDNLAPSQGGKYAGFGSSPPPTSSASFGGEPAIPTSDDFQKDPMAALTKGFGWLSSTVSKQAASVNKAYIQPGMKSLSDGEFAAQARATALQAGSYVQQGAKGVGDQFNKFVDPEFGGQPGAAGGGAGAGAGAGAGGASAAGRMRVEPENKSFWDSFGQAPSGPPREKKDFWDDFAAAGETATAKQGKSGSGGGVKPTSIGTSAMKTTGKKEEGDGWGDW